MTGGGRWLDRDAGPVVRSYALTGGRTRPSGAGLDLIDLVVRTRLAEPDLRGLGPEHRQLLGLCARPVAVADLAAETELPLGVVRVLLGDLQERGLVAVAAQADTASSEEDVLRSVLDGLRTL